MISIEVPDTSFAYIQLLASMPKPTAAILELASTGYKHFFFKEAEEHPLSAQHGGDVQAIHPFRV